jgi:predicted nucleotidyltransferase
MGDGRRVPPVKGASTGLRAREGDFLETTNGLLFDVKGLVHPPNRIVAYVRYVPDRHGDRTRNGVRYRRVYRLSDRYSLMETRYPEYLVNDPVFGERLIEVPIAAVAVHYTATSAVQRLLRRTPLDAVEEAAVALVQLLSEHSGVAIAEMGISGSTLVGLHTPASDIDLIVYGSENCRSVKATLQDLMNRDLEGVTRYDLAGLRRLYQARTEGPWISFAAFVQHELRKSSQGTYRGRDFFVRYLRDWHEVTERYGDRRYTTVGYSKITAVVTGDDDAIFTPCSYPVDDVDVREGSSAHPIVEIASFRGRFCEQASTGDRVEAQGKLERVEGSDGPHYRLLLGGDPRDYVARIRSSTQGGTVGCGR